MIDREVRAERLGRSALESSKCVLVPSHETEFGRLPLSELPLLPTGVDRLGLRHAVLDHMFRRLADDPPMIIETLATGTTGDLLKVPHGQDLHRVTVVLAQAREHNGADRDIDAHPQRVGTRNDLEQSFLR